VDTEDNENARTGNMKIVLEKPIGNHQIHVDYTHSQNSQLTLPPMWSTWYLGVKILMKKCFPVA
jgi:hypothetical protein